MKDIAFQTVQIERPLTKKELAQLVQSTPRFIEQEVKRGRLRMRQLSARLVRFMAADVIEWLEAK